MSRISIAAAFVAALLGGACPRPSYAQAASAQPGWIASWATSPQVGEADADEPLANLDGQTVRQRVRMSVGGCPTNSVHRR